MNNLDNDSVSEVKNSIHKKYKTKPRRYETLWKTVAEKANCGDFTPTVIKSPGLSDAIFKTIRKAFWKEKDLDKAEGGKWLAKVERGKWEEGKQELIYFSVMYKKIEDRI